MGTNPRGGVSSLWVPVRELMSGLMNLLERCMTSVLDQHGQGLGVEQQQTQVTSCPDCDCSGRDPWCNDTTSCGGVRQKTAAARQTLWCGGSCPGHPVDQLPSGWCTGACAEKHGSYWGSAPDGDNGLKEFGANLPEETLNGSPVVEHHSRSHYSSFGCRHGDDPTSVIRDRREGECRRCGFR